MNNVFKTFDNGFLRLPDATASFSDIEWSKHPTFEGVELKHIITSENTGGAFSYHLVKIAPGNRCFICETGLRLRKWQAPQ